MKTGGVSEKETERREESERARRRWRMREKERVEERGDRGVVTAWGREREFVPR